MEKRQSLIKGTVILICANVLVKIIGAIFKIPLTNLIGASGMADFSVAYNLYVVLFVISTAGIPVAISKMVAEANKNNKEADVPRIIKCAFGMFFLFSLVLTICMVIFAKEICIYIGSERSYLSILAIAPSVCLITIVSIFRGYYQGYQDMTKTAISQVIEAFFKLFIGYSFAKYLIEQGYDTSIASAGAIFGVTIGILFSFLYLCINILFFRKRYTKSPVTSNKNIVKMLIKIAIPVTIGASVLSLTNLVDMFTVMTRLQNIGVSSEVSNDLYGAYNMALTLYNLPQTAITALSISIIPVISGIYRDKARSEKIINSSLFMATTIACPCATGFILLSNDILNLLYYKRPEDVLMASPILVILGVAVVFVSVVAITNASMQAMSKPILPVFSMIVGLIVKWIANYFLISIPSINISGAPIGTVLCFLTITIINIINLKNVFKIRLNFVKIFIKPILASFVMGVFISFVDKSIIKIVPMSAVVYFLVLILINGIQKEDIGVFMNKRL